MTAAALTDLPAWAHELLEDGRVGHLGLLDGDDRPRVLPVTYAVTDDAVVTAIDEKPKRSREPARVRYLRRRPDAALTVDRYSDDWTQLAWVQVLGRVLVLDAADNAAALAALASKYSQYREAAPPGPLLRLEPHRVLHWRASAR